MDGNQELPMIPGTSPSRGTRQKALNSVGTVFICTTGFSPSLIRCLTSLSQQRVAPGFNIVKLTVVWNTNSLAAQASERQLDEWALAHWKGPLHLHQHWEPRRGIPQARNKALSVAIDIGLDWFAFIDDDCVAHPGWLETLTGRARETGADVVAGSWHIVPDGSPSSWLPRHIFGPKGYDPGGRPARDGDHLPTAYTRNVLVRMSAIDSAPEEARRFDESLSYRGGSDVIFFYGLSRAGSTIVYAKEAVVDEVYPERRMTLRWHFKRRIRNTQLRLSRAPMTGESTVSSGGSLLNLFHLLWRIPAGLLLAPISAVSHRVRRFIGTTALWSAPYIAALLHFMGIHYLEYADRFVHDSAFSRIEQDW